MPNQAITWDPVSRKHAPGSALAGSAFTMPSPRIQMRYEKHAGTLNDGSGVDCFTTIVVPVEGMDPAFYQDRANEVRLELLVYQPSSRSMKRDAVRGNRTIKQPAGWYHTSDLYAPSPSNGTRGGSHSDPSGKTKTEWLIHAMAPHDRVVIPIAECFANYFRMRTLSDVNGSTIDTPVATRKFANYPGKHGITRAGTRRAFAFRWAYTSTDRLPIEGPISPIVWAGNPWWPTQPTGNTSLDPQTISTTVFTSTIGSSKSLAASFSPVLRLSIGSP